jgi:hypothetical protein
MIKQHQLRRRESILTLHRKFIAPVCDFALFDSLHNRSVEKPRRFVARVEVRGSGNRRGFCIATRSDCLVGCAIPVGMTWGLLGRVLVLGEEGGAFVQGGGYSPTWLGPWIYT